MSDFYPLLLTLRMRPMEEDILSITLYFFDELLQVGNVPLF